MNKKKMVYGAAVAILLAAAGVVSGCNNLARRVGGTVTVTLPADQKLINASWKTDDSIWFLTRPMRDGEKAETYTYKEDSQFGVLEGTVIIKEVRKDGR